MMELAESKEKKTWKLNVFAGRASSMGQRRDVAIYDLNTSFLGATEKVGILEFGSAVHSLHCINLTVASKRKTCLLLNPY